MTYRTPEPPTDQGDWTLLQSRLDRSFWQWDRETSRGTHTRFVILRFEDRYEYDTFDEAEALFLAFDEEQDAPPMIDLGTF